MPPEVDDDEPLRWYVMTAYVVLVIAGFALAVWCSVDWFSTCSDSSQTGTATSYAGDSMRGTLCESGHRAAGLLVAGGWLLGLALATFALLRWGGGAARAFVLGVLLLAPAGLPAAAYGGLISSSGACTGHKLDSYSAWVDAGSKGQAPYDCRTF